jgi:VanZ family protein
MRYRARFIVPLAWMAVIWMLSSLPAAADQTIGGIFLPTLLQKTAHLVVYAVLGSLWFWVFDFGRLVKAAAVWACCLTTAYAAVDEFHQTFVPGRYGSPWDVALDAVGVLLGLTIIGAVRRRRKWDWNGTSNE